jgi:uncharacterized protein YggE
MELGLQGKVAGVETRGATPAEALDGCRDALGRVLAALDAAGIEPARRTTSELDLQEDWETRQPGKGPVAYRVTTRLNLRLPDPAGAGQVAAAAVAAGGDGARVHGLELVVGDPAVEPGEATIWATVTVTWALAEGPG